MTTFPSSVPSQLFIDGVWRNSGDSADDAVIDPATEEVIARVSRATESDIDDALASADRGFRLWRNTDAWTRSRVLRRVADILREWASEAALVMTSEQGKPLAEAQAEWMATADQFDWYADEARRIYGRTVDGHSTSNRILVVREPIGVVAAFSAWNFPALLPARKIAPALAAGCSIIVKPASEAPLSTLLIAEACLQAGVPAGVVTMVTGSSGLISERLIASPTVRKISLTGSVPVGRVLLHAAAERITHVSMELGGHAPVLVFADADIAAAARACVASKFRNAGQVCASPSRFIVHESVQDEFIAEFVAATDSLQVGNGRDPQTHVGPLTSLKRIQAAEELISDAVSGGAVVAAGGGRDPRFEKGFYFQPTVLTGVQPDRLIMREEPFAPVAPITPFADLEQALEIANSTEFGLASYLFTRDLGTAFAASAGLEAGMVGVNTMSLATAEAPFGGIKASGYGREGGTEGVMDYTVAKYINMAIA